MIFVLFFNFSCIPMNILHSIDSLFNKLDSYLDNTLPQIKDIRFWSLILPRKLQLYSMFLWWFLTATLLLVQVGVTFAHGWHGDEEAEQLWASSVIMVSWPQFVSPIEIDASSIGIQSYPWIIISDEYGSIYSSREWIVSQLFVTLWDIVRKGQKVATISISSNTPEIIWMIAEKKASIAIAEWQVNGARKVFDYLQWQVGWSGAIVGAYNQKRTALDISFDVQKQQLQVKINNLTAQINSKKQLVDASKLVSQSTIWLNREKQASIESALQSSIQSAIASLAKVFAKWETIPLSFDREFSQNIYLWARDISSRNTFQSSMRKVFSDFAKRDSLDVNGKLRLAEFIQQTLKEWVIVLSYTIIYSGYSPEQLSEDTELLINAQNNENYGVGKLLSDYKELQQELLWSNAVASWNIIQANVELAWLEQEIALLNKEIELLENEKKKELADLEWDQSIQWLDIQQLVIQSQADIFKAEAELEANKQALSAIIGATKSISVVAPFAGTISRKNVSIGQNIELSTPLFDIAWNSTKSKSFVRFEIPVSEFKKVGIWQALQISLAWTEDHFVWQIARIAQSVNKENQTITIEGDFTEEAPYPLWTTLRVSAQSLSWAKVLEIPSSAIGQDEDWKMWVYKLLLSNQTLKKRNLDISYTDQSKSYINNGLKTTDLIVSDIIGWNWIDGMDVSSLLKTNE